LNPLDQPPLSTGKRDQFINPKRWERFVRTALEVTVQAYRNLREQGIAKLTWEEDHFTINLENYIRPLAFQKSLTVVSQVKTYTPKMETGEVSVKQAKILDLRIWGRWENYHQVHFIWECKRVADGCDDKAYKGLIPEYIKEGIFRFLDEEYAIGLDDAGMLAYVLAGDIPSIVSDINKSMQSSQRKRQLDVADHLQLASPVGTFTHIYQSCHKRMKSMSIIRLHHLFLVFDFAQHE